MSDQPTPADLIQHYHQLSGWLDTESKRLEEYYKPHRVKLEEIKNQLLAMLNEQNLDSFKSEHGTAYKSEITTPKIIDKEKFLDFVLEDWGNRGELLQIAAPQKSAFENYMQENNGALPPFTEVSKFIRLNIRRS